jgi:hypothetical protein
LKREEGGKKKEGSRRMKGEEGRRMEGADWRMEVG